MSTSGLSDLSSPLSSEDDNVINSIRGGGKIDHYITKSSGAEPAASPAKRKRAPSPPHEYVLADNPDIAVSHNNAFFAFLICLQNIPSRMGRVADVLVD